MKTIKLDLVKHDRKSSQDCEYIEPNITEDCLLESEGEIVGFYIRDIDDYSPRLSQLLSIANAEFRSDNVPKQFLDRADVIKLGGNRTEARKKGTAQWSTILGSVPPNAMTRRHYRNRAAVHNHTPAQVFIKAMTAAAIESGKIIKEIAPQIYHNQLKVMESISKEWRFGDLFTSSISNFNIAASFHTDVRNVKGAVNVIMTKRNNSKGGCLHVPDYNATFEQADNSLLVYPAWRNMHGVTPIVPTHTDGYRNSLIFYSLKAFKDD
tara:strand:+ start:8306 stop:9103 length:798 start_codon:yes stop_codon:yes gene_type:complete